MKIAVLCWGSLHWDQGCLKLNGDEWETDGPELPLEFCRISSAGKPNERVTLVVYQNGSKCKTYWRIHESNSLEIAKANLACREGGSLRIIASVCKSDTPTDEIAKVIADWLKNRSDLDAAIWTNLKENWEEKLKKSFSLSELRRYLNESREKPHWEKIHEYFLKAPQQTQTDGRKLFNKEFR